MPRGKVPLSSLIGGKHVNNKGFDLWTDGYDKTVGISDCENTYPFAGYKEVLGSIFRVIMKKQHAVILDINLGTDKLL